MVRRAATPWLPRLFSGLALATAGGLILLVLLTPWLDNGNGGHSRGERLLALFARDATVRRTAVASALGLVVTARVFFRSPGLVRRPPSKNSRRTAGGAGA
jgi:hypothetical protein